MIHTLFFPCREAARLISLRQQQELRIDQSLRLGVHLRMCKACRRFSQQVRLIDGVFRLRARSDEAALPTSPDLAAEARERIRKRCHDNWLR